MKLKSRYSALAVAGVVALAGCGSSGPNLLTVEDVVGTWAATNVLMVAQQNSAMQVELVSLGGSFTITVAADGSYTQTATFPGGQPEVEQGTFSLANPTASTASATMAGQGGSSLTFTLEKVGNTITLDGTQSMEFPVPGAPPGEIPVDLSIVLTRT